MNRERFRWRVTLAAAVALHALLAAFLAGQKVERVRAPSAPDEMLVWVDEPSVPSPGDDSGEKGSRSGASEGARVALRAIPTLPRGGDLPAEPVGPGEPSDPSSGRDFGAPGAPVDEHLSLDALGIGENPFLGDAAKRIAEPPPAARGIRRSLTDAIAKSDQARGLGPEAPLLARLEVETRGSDAPGNSTALFRATTDARGRLIGFELVEASAGAREYRLLAARVLEKLRDVRLRIPRGVRGVTMDLRVISHVELPSGRDPGLGVDLLGIPLKKPGGEKSPRVSILRIDPKGYKVELPNGKTIALPSMPLGQLLELDGDPVDIGAKAQRMVRAHLEHLSAEAADASELPAE